MHIFREGGNIKLDNNDFILKIVAELEKKGIKTGFDKLKRELEKDPAKIDVILDTSGTVGKTKGSIKKLAAELHNELSVEISKLQKQGQDINFDLSVGDVEEVIQNVINHTKKLGESFDVASDKAQKFLAKFNKKSGGVLINSDEFKAVQEAINGLGNTHTIEDLNKAMNTLEVTYDNMSSKLRNSGKSLNPFINAKNEMSTMDKTIEGISLEFDKLSSKPDDVTNAIKELSVQQDMVNSFTIGTMEWAEAYGHLQQMIVNVTKDISNLQKAQSSKSLQPRIDEIQLSMDNGYGVSEYQNRINAVTASLEKYGVETQEAKNITASLQSTFDSMKGMSGQDLVTQADKLEQEFKAVKVSVDQAKLSYDKYMQPVSNEKETSLINRINSFLTKNTKITNDAKVALQGYIDELSRGVNLSRWNEINGVLKKTENSMRGLGRLGASLKDQMSQAAQSFTQWLSVSSAVMLGVSKTKEAISELIELDSILTEISKTSDLTNQQLRELGNTAFDSASKYGRSAADYLTGVQEMYRAGFKNAEEMAELSLLAQAAGDMESNSANDYLMATNAAYNYKGSVEELNKVLDSQNYITNNAAVSMQDMADATSEAASIAAQYGVEIDELSALIAVATSKTRESGSEVGTALKSIFVTLQDTTSKPVVEAFDAVGISMTKIVNGSEQLKTPIELLKELSVAFNELPEGDTKRANILTDIGKKYHANTLSAILSDWESYESMLELYSQGIGSAANEAEKSANNIEGSLNRLSNTWTDTIENILNSDAILTVVKALNGLLSVINNVTDKLGSLGTIGLGAGLFAGVKNSGVRKCVLFICFCFEYALFSQEMTISRVEMCGFSQPTRVLK
jgi:TP901 family phage tail tape measure protein